MKQRSSRPAYSCPTPKHGKQQQEEQQLFQPQQQQQEVQGELPSEQQQMAQRLELLESAMMVIGGLAERK